MLTPPSGIQSLYQRAVIGGGVGGDKEDKKKKTSCTSVGHSHSVFVAHNNLKHGRGKKNGVTWS